MRDSETDRQGEQKSTGMLMMVMKQRKGVNALVLLNSLIHETQTPERL